MFVGGLECSKFLHTHIHPLKCCCVLDAFRGGKWIALLRAIPIFPSLEASSHRNHPVGQGSVQSMCWASPQLQHVQGKVLGVSLIKTGEQLELVQQKSRAIHNSRTMKTQTQSAASYSCQFLPQTFLSPKCATQPTQTTHCLYSPS